VPDIPNRSQLEKKIARLLGKYNSEQLRKLLDLMGNSPSLTKIPPEFWTESQQALAAELVPFAEQVYVEAAQRVIEQSPIGIEWSLVNQGAADWSTRYVGQLVKDITGTTQRDVGSAVSNYFTQAETIGDLEKALVGMQDRFGRTFGPIRAEMIAVTEVTRAAAQGELAVANELKKEGIQMRKVWQTNNDELVCPICGPLHNKEEGIWRQQAPDGPPAHPRCRCWLNLLLPKPAGDKTRSLDELLIDAKDKYEERRLIEQWVVDNSLDAGELKWHGMSETATFKVVDFNGIRWLYEADDPYSTKRLASSIRTVRNMNIPDSLSKHTSNILYTSQRNRQDKIWGERFNMKNFISTATSGDGSIVYYDGSTATEYNLIHEMGHNLALRRYGRVVVPSKSDYGRLWMRWRNNPALESPVSDYGKVAIQEDFAEAVEMYINNNEKMLNYPERYSVIQKLLLDESYGG